MLVPRGGAALYEHRTPMCWISAGFVRCMYTQKVQGYLADNKLPAPPPTATVGPLHSLV
jgi:hypothetical protein